MWLDELRGCVEGAESASFLSEVSNVTWWYPNCRVSQWQLETKTGFKLLWIAFRNKDIGHVCVPVCMYVCYTCVCSMQSHMKTRGEHQRSSSVTQSLSTWSSLGMPAGQQAPATLPPISISPTHTVTSTWAVGMCDQPLTLDDCWEFKSRTS